jgi:L-lactate dehydrogenase (cytochrome)
VVIKGVLDAEDARIALDHGVDGLVVSNHGGRQLDDVPSTAAALGRIVEAVGTRTDIMVDGGVRSGLDVLKMLALGADGVLIGRAWAWAVAARGRTGVEHVLRILRSELEVAMSLTGITSIAAADPAILVALGEG